MEPKLYAGGWAARDLERDLSMTAIDIICPAFREEATIAHFHETLERSIADLERSHRFRFLYVVDPAGDGTEAILQNIAERDERVTVIVLSRRFGHQASLVAGIDASTGDAVIMLDSDLQHPPGLIPEMIRRWEAGADIVQMLRRDGQETTRSKRVTSRWFYELLGRISSIKLQSGAADFRLISRRVADVFRDEIRESSPFMRGLVSWVGFNIVYLPFEPSSRLGGQSNYTIARLLSFALNGFCSFSKLPLRACIVVGLAVSFVSLVGSIIYIFLYFLGDASVPGWASLFVLTSVATGLNMLFLGILGEYVSLIFDEVKARPRYIVERMHGMAPALGSAPVDGHRAGSGRTAIRS